MPFEAIWFKKWASKELSCILNNIKAMMNGHRTPRNCGYVQKNHGVRFGLGSSLPVALNTASEKLLGKPLTGNWKRR